MAVYVLATGAQSAFECFRKNDPAPCRQYLEGLKDPLSDGGLLLFSGTSAGATALAAHYLGTEGWKGMIPSSGGLAAGMIVQELFTEAIRNPKSILTSDFLEDQASSLASMLITAGALAQGKNIADGLLSLALSPESNTSICVQDSLWKKIGSARPGPIRKLQAGKYGIIARGLMGIGELIAFSWISGKIKEGLDAGKNAALLDRPLSNPPKNPPKDEPELDARLALWQNYRRNLLSQTEPTMMLYRSQLKQFDDDFIKRGYFYKWIASGMKDSGTDWDFLRSSYYPKARKPEDIRKKVTDRYLTGFFCGVDPKEAFRPSLDLHGDPVPFRSAPVIKDYRVIPDRNPELCQSGEDKTQAMRQALTKTHYGDMTADANAAVSDVASKERNKMVDRYERETDRKLLRTLAGPSTQRPKKLPNGVIPSFDSELAELNRFLSQTQDPAMAKEIQKRITWITEEKSTAQEISDYVRNRAQNPSPPTINTDQKADPGFKNAQDYFKDYILRKKDGFQ